MLAEEDDDDEAYVKGALPVPGPVPRRGESRPVAEPVPLNPSPPVPRGGVAIPLPLIREPIAVVGRPDVDVDVDVDGVEEPEATGAGIVAALFRRLELAEPLER